MLPFVQTPVIVTFAVAAEFSQYPVVVSFVAVDPGMPVIPVIVTILPAVTLCPPATEKVLPALS